MSELVLFSPRCRSYLLRLWLDRGSPSIVIGETEKYGVRYPWGRVIQLGKFLSYPCPRAQLVRILDALGRADWSEEEKEIFEKELL